MKRKSALLISLVLSLTFFVNPQAGASDLAFDALAKIQAPANSQLVVIGGETNLGPEFSRMVMDYSNDGKKVLYGLNYNAVLPKCDSVTDLLCIEAVESKKSDSSNWQAGTFQSYYQFDKSATDLVPGNIPSVIQRYSHDWLPDASNGLPASSSTSTWTLPGASYGAASTYQVTATLSGYAPSSPNFIQNQSQKLAVKIVPVSNGNPYNFEKGISFRLTLRLGVSIDRIWNFYNARIQNSNFTIDKSTPSNRLIIEGEPLTTSIGQTSSKTIEQMSENYRKSYLCPGSSTNYCQLPLGVLRIGFGGYLPTTPFGGYGGLNPKRAFDNFFSLIERYTNEFGPFKGVGEKTEWYFITPTTSLYSPCKITDSSEVTTFTHDYLGYLTTNAATAVSDLPYFDSENSSLTYAVAAPHLKGDGSINSGLYQIAIAPTLAKCWWGKDLSNSQAKISITSDGAEPQVIISNLKLVNNMYIFTASGFHYSNPRISIVLIKGTSDASNSAAKKITCQKGKVKKLISGAKPVCPSGYKKV